MYSSLVGLPAFLAVDEGALAAERRGRELGVAFLAGVFFGAGVLALAGVFRAVPPRVLRGVGVTGVGVVGALTEVAVGREVARRVLGVPTLTEERGVLEPPLEEALTGVLLVAAILMGKWSSTMSQSSKATRCSRMAYNF